MSEKTLGGSLFAHNAVRFDYCLEEAIHSLAALCDEVVLLEAESDDGTVDVMQRVAGEYPHVTVYDHGLWECAPDKDRLNILANQAKDLLKTDWHFMLQADEVIHEKSFPAIRDAMASGKAKSYRVRRFNLYRDCQSMVRLDLPNGRKPCSDEPVRLALPSLNAGGDAESIVGGENCPDFTDRINVFHYGFVRRGDLILDKVIDMQGWFFGPGGQPDRRVVEMKAKGEQFQYDRIMTDDLLCPVPMAHPVFSVGWATERDRLRTEAVEG